MPSVRFALPGPAVKASGLIRPWALVLADSKALPVLHRAAEFRAEWQLASNASHTLPRLVPWRGSTAVFKPAAGAVLSL